MSPAIVNVFYKIAIWSASTLTLLFCITPKYHCTKDKAYATAMKSDLRNMVSAQEEYRAEHGHFATDAVLRSGALGFRQSTGVNLTIVHADANGWIARTSHAAIPKITCTISSVDGEPRCHIPKNPWRPRFTGDATLNVAIDFWLIAFSLARRRRAIARASWEPAPAI